MILGIGAHICTHVPCIVFNAGNAPQLLGKPLEPCIWCDLQIACAQSFGTCSIMTPVSHREMVSGMRAVHGWHDNRGLHLGGKVKKADPEGRGQGHK